MATFSIIDSEQYKECPRCGATLFSDMETCYGCMFNFAAAKEDVCSRENVVPKEIEAEEEKQYFCNLKIAFWANRPLFFSSEQFNRLKQSFSDSPIELDEVSFSTTESAKGV